MHMLIILALEVVAEAGEVLFLAQGRKLVVVVLHHLRLPLLLVQEVAIAVAVQVVKLLPMLKILLKPSIGLK